MLTTPEITDTIEYMVTQRLKDQCVQEWNDTSASRTKHDFFFKFKNVSNTKHTLTVYPYKIIESK